MSIVQMLDFREAFSTFALPESLELRRGQSMGRIWLRHAHPGCVEYNISVTTKPNTRRQYTRPSRALLEHVVRIFEHLFDRASGLIRRIGWPIAFDQPRPQRLLADGPTEALKKKKPHKSENLWGFVTAFGGDGGIRTLDPGFGPDAPLAGECLRPLGHVSQTFARTREAVRRERDNIGFRTARQFP